jgi:hypothetical protein
MRLAARGEKDRVRLTVLAASGRVRPAGAAGTGGQGTGNPRRWFA